MSVQAAESAAFRRMHEQGVLVLPNVWDGGSARLIESLGARALATTSAGVAWSHGYADGDLLPTPLLLESVRTIARVARVPLSVDVEGGYSHDPAAVGELIAQVVDAGAVGINLEDGAREVDLLCAKIEQAKRAAGKRGIDLFVNARTDVYLRGLAPAEGRVEESLRRAERYASAGADGIFVPGVTDTGEIRTLAAGVGRPLNVLARPGLPPVAALRDLGVRRLSAGSWVASAAFGRLRTVVNAFLNEGVCDPFFEGAWLYAEVNELLAREFGAD
jgi:2-methylisocitrate lyase-like PEP mutase family enzyme